MKAGFYQTPPNEEVAAVARISIDDSLFRDNRFMEFMVRVGGLEPALGAIVRAWMTAQKYWAPRKEPIPREVWDRQRLNPAIIECGLAEERDGGVYMRGSEEQFAWLIQRIEAGAKGGLATAQRRCSRGLDDPDSEPPEAAGSSGRSATDQQNIDQNEQRSLGDPPATAKQTQASYYFYKDKYKYKENTVSTEHEKTVVFGAVETFRGDPEIEGLLSQVSQASQARWLKLYPDPGWLRSQFLRMTEWLEANPRKRPRSKPGRFIGGWLARGWEQYRKTLASNSPVRINTKPIELGAP